LVGELRFLESRRVFVGSEDEFAVCRDQRALQPIVRVLNCPLREVEIEGHRARTGAEHGLDEIGLQSPINRQKEGIGFERRACDGDDGKAWMGRRQAVGQQSGAPVGGPVLELQERRCYSRNAEEAKEPKERGNAKRDGIPRERMLALVHFGQQATFLPRSTRLPLISR